MTHSKKWILYCDGASRGNPGEAACGALLIDPNGKKIPFNKYLGVTTNNQAEYEALILGLLELKKRKAQDIEVRADSQLMVRQMLGEYRVKHPDLIPLYQHAKSLLENFNQVDIKHIYREENGEADKLANEALDFNGRWNNLPQSKLKPR